MLTTKIIRRKWHWVPYTIAIVIVLLTILARLYLGTQWITMILGTIFLGLFILFAFILVYQRRPKMSHELNLRASTWYASLTIAILLPWLFANAAFFKAERIARTPYSLQFHINVAAWWNQPLEYLPTYRNGRFGSPVQPFNIQWAGRIDDIQKTLMSRGWTVYGEEMTMKNAIKRFASLKPEDRTPIFPWLYLNKPPVLYMFKRLENKQSTIIEIRLWETNVHFYDSNSPLWLGTLNFHAAPAKLLGFHHPQAISFSPPDVVHVLDENIKGLTNTNTEIWITNTLQLPPRIKALHWNGHILVIRSYHSNVFN